MFISPDKARDPNFFNELKNVIQKFDFDLNTSHPFFDEKPEPPSDNVHLLKIVIKKIPQNSKILSIPTHYNFYRSDGLEVVLFDISPGQIKEYAGRKEQGMYWCDIFTPKALSLMLDEVQPNVVDISNIQEWASKENQEQFVTKISSHKSIKYLVFSSPFLDAGYKVTSVFIDLLRKHGWTVVKYQESNNDQIYPTSSRISSGIIYFATKN